MRPGWNPARRNRNIAAKAHAREADNGLTLPESWQASRVFHERPDAHVALKRQVGGRTLLFIVEPTRAGWFHPCTVDDACTALTPLPRDDLATIDLVVMSQPTRKQRILCPVWGRAIFDFDATESSGSAIVLEAQNCDSLTWPISLTPERRRELDRLREDGHDVRRGRRHYEIHSTPRSLRNTVLYRTLLHELGHHVDHRRCSVEQWESRTPSEKEDFAHRYAAQAFCTLRALGIAPFEPAPEYGALLASGLDPAWFAPA